MKRSHSTSPSPSLTPSDSEADLPSTPSPVKKQKKSPATPKTPKSSPSKRKTVSDGSRGALLDEIIGLGAKVADMAALAEKYGMSRSQLIDQFKPNRANLRSKAVRAVSGEQ